MLHGIEDILRTYRVIVAHAPWPTWAAERDLNGLPALLVRYPDREGRYARDVVFWIELDRDDKIAAIRGVVASSKLGAVRLG